MKQLLIMCIITLCVINTGQQECQLMRASPPRRANDQPNIIAFQTTTAIELRV